jgi:hypothetical protein
MQDWPITTARSTWSAAIVRRPSTRSRRSGSTTSRPTNGATAPTCRPLAAPSRWQCTTAASTRSAEWTLTATTLARTRSSIPRTKAGAPWQTFRARATTSVPPPSRARSSSSPAATTPATRSPTMRSTSSTRTPGATARRCRPGAAVSRWSSATAGSTSSAARPSSPTGPSPRPSALAPGLPRRLAGARARHGCRPV